MGQQGLRRWVPWTERFWTRTQIEASWRKNNGAADARRWTVFVARMPENFQAARSFSKKSITTSKHGSRPRRLRLSSRIVCIQNSLKERVGSMDSFPYERTARQSVFGHISSDSTTRVVCKRTRLPESKQMVQAVASQERCQDRCIFIPQTC